MSNRLGVTTIAATLLFWPLSSLKAGEVTGIGARTTIVSPDNPDPTRFADLSRQAPIGHRQPRPSDLTAPVQVTRVDAELRRLDDEIDRKLVICRGC